MPNTNILLFDENKQNLMSDLDYSNDSRRSDGLQSGVASSSLQNKFQYQMSLIAKALAEIMVNNGYDALDTDLPTTFINNLSSSLWQKNSFPQMLYGVEYETGEYFNVEKVYCKLLNTGGFDESTPFIGSFAHGITNIKNLIDIKCIVSIAYPPNKNPGQYSYYPAIGEYRDVFYKWYGMYSSSAIQHLQIYSINVDETNINFLYPKDGRTYTHNQFGPDDNNGASCFECIKSSYTLIKYTKNS